MVAFSAVPGGSSTAGGYPSAEFPTRAQRAVDQLFDYLPAVRAVAVVDVAAARLVAGRFTDAEFSVGQMLAVYRELVDGPEAALAAVADLGPALSLVMLVLDPDIHLLQPLPAGLGFVYVIADADGLDLDAARRALEQQAGLLAG